MPICHVVIYFETLRVCCVSPIHYCVHFSVSASPILQILSYDDDEHNDVDENATSRRNIISMSNYFKDSFSQERMTKSIESRSMYKEKWLYGELLPAFGVGSDYFPGKERDGIYYCDSRNGVNEVRRHSSYYYDFQKELSYLGNGWGPRIETHSTSMAQDHLVNYTCKNVEREQRKEKSLTSS
ncbi:hypothetical protein QVD17_13891 [Tagetes erecta]|uniref:Uncharacterized protein n=1 Tax=Tagetes erecta TaxID=13708 RepID=A0AAD8P3Q6_TARER|nr:hypothetical protein QVD17_13891 [Tagetes erecta]